MRLRRLSLDRFGHFTGHTFNFGEPGGAPDFHIIHGPNEAGKTTTMEAVLRLFYGFPLREPYAFKHPRAALQVSATLDLDGAERHLTRLPRRAGTLVDTDGNALPETALSAHLAGLREADYRTLLCLDDDTIERGGEEIAQARGDIGRLLFSAAAGVADLSAVLDGVADEAAQLWKKGASKTRIAGLKRALKEIEKETRDNDVSASAWKGLRKALADAREAEAAARGDRDALQARTTRVAALRRAVPGLARIDQCDARIAPRADYPERLDFDPESLVALLAEQAGAQTEAERLAAAIQRAEADRAAQDAAPRHPGLEDALEALSLAEKRDATAAEDLDRRRAEIRDAEAAMARAAADLDPVAGTAPGALVLSQAALARLESARDALRAARARAEDAEQELLAQRDSRDRARDAVVRAERAAPGDEGVADLLARHDADGLAPAAAAARQSIAEAAETAAEARAALTRGATRFATLPDCPVGPAQAKAWADEEAELDARIRQTEDAAAGHREDAAARAAQADALMQAEGLMPEADLEALRATRDRLWQAHRGTLDGDGADRFAAAMHRLDEAMRLRVAQAGDLGQLRQIEDARATARARADEAASRLAALRARRTALHRTVADAAAQVGLAMARHPEGQPAPAPAHAGGDATEPPPETPDIPDSDRSADARAIAAPAPGPADWLAWVEAHATAATAVDRLDRLEEAHRATFDRAGRLRDALAARLDLVEPSFDGALAAARAQALADRDARAALTRARDALETIEVDLARREARAETARAEADARDREWQALVAETTGDAIAPDTLLAGLDPLRRLTAEDGKRADTARRVARMEQDRARFADAVAALAADHGIAEAETPAATFARLKAAAESARTARGTVAALDRTIAESRTAQAEVVARLDAIDRDVDAMGRIFPPGTPVDTLGALRTAATGAADVIEARAERQAQAAALLADLGATDLDAVRRELGKTDPATLEAEARTLNADLAAAETRLTAATEARVTAQETLRQVTPDADIALLRERRATLELELEEAALDHLALSLGHRLAGDAIRRYRDAHRSGMMQATEQAFAALTQGAYTRLTTQPEGTTETLLALDAAGTAKRVSDLSKGTRFQLYLALRAAAHEQMVAQGTRLPFFCDDIFETFDEARTSAACRVMARIGSKGQAIYLTHHRHVVDIAREVCDVPPTVHEI